MDAWHVSYLGGLLRPGHVANKHWKRQNSDNDHLCEPVRGWASGAVPSVSWLVMHHTRLECGALLDAPLLLYSCPDSREGIVPRSPDTQPPWPPSLDVSKN